MIAQLGLFNIVQPDIKPLDWYDLIIVSGSGGKDSTAMLLWTLAQVFPAKVQYWHQCVDGRGFSAQPFFDWQSTPGYVRQLTRHFGVRLAWQWREGGFKRELYRENQHTGDVYAEWDDTAKVHILPTTGGKATTRRRWPAKAADLNRRWCSAYLKIDVAARVLSATVPINRANPRKVLFLTGERREESAARAKYPKFELHRTYAKGRTVHHYRPVIDWTETQVWEAMEQQRIVPHPAYYLGFPRLSCRSCIFYSPDHWATLQAIQPDVLKMIRDIEEEFAFTLDNKLTIYELASRGKSLLTPENVPYIKLATEAYDLPITTDKWVLPKGAFGTGGGSL